MLVDEMILKLSADVSGLVDGQKKFEATLDSMRSKSEETGKKNVRSANDVDSALRKQRQTEAKAEKERESAAKKQGESLIKLRNEIVGVTAAYVGFSALKGIGENLLKMNAQMGFSADTLGMSEDGLNSWIQVASTFNASAEEVTGAFGKINAIQSSLKTGVGTGASIAALTQYAQSVAGLTSGKVAVDMGRLSNRETSSEEFLSELSAEVQKMSLKDATIALANLGIGPNIARMLHDIDIGGKLDAAKKTDDEAKNAIQNAKELAQQWARIKAQAKGVADVIENDVMPYLKKFADMAADVLGYAKEHPKTTETVVGAGAALVAGVSAYIGGKMVTGAFSSPGAKKVAVDAAKSGAKKVAVDAAKSGAKKVAVDAAKSGAAKAAYRAGLSGAEEVAAGTTSGRILLGTAVVGGALLGLASSTLGKGSGRGYKTGSGDKLSDEDKRTLYADILKESGGNQLVAQRQYNNLVRNWHAGGNRAGNTNSSEVHIGQLTVTTQAKDAPGVAAELHRTLQHWSLATNANNGIR